MPRSGVVLGPIVMIVVIAATVLIAAWLPRAFGILWQNETPDKGAMDILNERFARGEIDDTEYARREKALTQ